MSCYRELSNDILVKKSYTHCKNIFYKNSKSYFIGSCLFPIYKFKHICSIYSLLRVADDIVDKNHNDKKIKLKLFRNSLFELMELSWEDIYRRVTKEIRFYNNEDKVLLAVTITIKELRIDKVVFERFFNSMLMDLQNLEYKNINNLEIYMDGSAAVVGEIMLKIMDYDNKNGVNNYEIVDNNYTANEFSKLFPFCRSLGLAMQLTNFLRDIKEDLDMKPSRIYMTTNDLTTFNIDLKKIDSIYTQPDLIYSISGGEEIEIIKNNFESFMEYQIQRNIELYEYSDIGIDSLHIDDMKPVKLGRNLYSGILGKIRDNNYNVFHEKIRLSYWEKLNIIFNILDFNDIFYLIYNYMYYTFFL